MDRVLLFILVLYILIEAFQYLLEYLNIKQIKKYGTQIPPEFEGHIDEKLLRKTLDYTVENSRFGFISSIFSNIVVLIFIFSGLLNYYNSLILSFNYSFILTGLAFFLILSYCETLISIPFSLYRNFKIENKYGFNTMTIKLWISDFVKSIVISTLLMCLLMSGGLWLISKSPDNWWIWVWCFFLSFSLFIMYISPYVIEPLFNKFTPVKEEKLEGEIKKLMNKVGIRVSSVFKMDASKRSKHTNAYFTGIGKVKRIVLFDTLIEKMNHGEILSVLAHEAGHWKKKHLLKHLIIFETISFAVIFIAFRILESDYLAMLFKIEKDSFFVKLVLLGFLGGIVSFPFTPLFSYFSRKNELEADRFSGEVTGDGKSMISSLVKLSKDNLSNLYPHPLYVKFHYSHPPVVDRIKQIREAEAR